MKKIFILNTLIGILFISCTKDDCDNSTDETICDSISEIIEQENFNDVDTSTYVITQVELNEHCLSITMGASGCNPEFWGLDLYSIDAFYTIFPLQRAVKVNLRNDQLCEAYFEKLISFDLTPFQIEGQNELPLNIESWDEQIIYEY